MRTTMSQIAFLIAVIVTIWAALISAAPTKSNEEEESLKLVNIFSSKLHQQQQQEPHQQKQQQQQQQQQREDVASGATSGSTLCSHNTCCDASFMAAPCCYLAQNQVCCGCWAGRANRHSDPVVVIAPQEGLNGHSAVVLHTSNSFPLAAAMSRVQDEQLQENGNGLDLQSGTRDHQQQQAAPLAFLSWLVNTARNSGHRAETETSVPADSSANLISARHSTASLFHQHGTTRSDDSDHLQHLHHQSGLHQVQSSLQVATDAQASEQVATVVTLDGIKQEGDEGLDAAAAAAAAAQPGIKQEGETPMDVDAETDKEQEQGNEGSLSITSSLVIQSSSSESPASISADNQQQPEAQQEPIKSDEPDNQESIQTPEEPQAADPDSLPVFEPEPEPEPASLVLPVESETPKSEPTALESKQPPVEQEAVVDEVIAAEKDNEEGPEAEPEPQVEQQQQKTSASESPMENETTSQVFVAGTETSSALSSTEEQHIAALQQNEGQTVIVTSTADQAKDSDSPVVILATSAEQSPPQINDEPEVEIIQADPDRVSADNTEAPIVPTMEPVDDQKTESPAQQVLAEIQPQISKVETDFKSAESLLADDTDQPTSSASLLTSTDLIVKAHDDVDDDHDVGTAPPSAPSSSSSKAPLPEITERPTTTTTTARTEMSTISTMTTATSNSKTPVVMTDASEKDFIPKRPQFDSTFLRSPSFWVVLDKKRPGKVLH